ncbi:hypothetical protein [Paenibacillus sp. 1P07SE]|uniref:hypothetical protein n=1 Tax=Paenibacillus sp. 1P07SE TaxID=3132209 RepID=UPI0039A41610
MAKRKWIVLMAVLLVLSTVLAACSGGNNEDGGEPATPPPASGEGNTPDNSAESGRSAGGLSLPIVQDKLELTLWSPSGGNFRGTNFNEKH